MTVLRVTWREAGAAFLTLTPGRLADRFWDDFADALARIAADPTSLPWFPQAVSDETRYKRIGRSRYLVLFTTADPAETVAFAVIHDVAGPARIAAAERRA